MIDIILGFGYETLPYEQVVTKIRLALLALVLILHFARQFFF
jgi:hypothetical protein